MVEDAAHDFLGHVTVDEPGAEGVSPLVWSEMDPVSPVVSDVAMVEPAVEGEPVGRTADRGAAVWVLRGPREQHRSGADPGLLFADQGTDLLVDGDQRFAFHLVVEV